MSTQPAILVVSRDKQLGDVRKAVLEDAGYAVIPALDFTAVRQACANHSLKLVMLGYSLPPSEKRRVWVEVKKLCNVPVLEMHRNEKPELKSPAYFHESHTVDDFLKTVVHILSQ